MKKKHWADIPPLEELEMEWDYKPDNPLGKRAFIRMNSQDLSKLTDEKRIVVKIATADKNAAGTLQDISEGGLAINLKSKLMQNQVILVGLFLGTEKIITRAQVRHVHQQQQEFTIGLMFVDLNKHSKKYIGECYAAKVLRHAF